MNRGTGVIMKKVLVTAGAYALCLGPGIAQGAPAAQPWSGQVECKVHSGGAAARTETQTWTLTGGAPTQQGAFTMYPATWSATGKGDGLRGAWTLDAPAQPTVITVFVRASDQRLIFKQGAAPASVNGALKTAKAGIPLSANEWNFGSLEAEASATRVSGSRQGLATALPAMLGAASTAMQCECSFSTEGLATAQSASTASEPAQLQIQRPANTTATVLQRAAPGTQSAPASAPAVSGPKYIDTAVISISGKGPKPTDVILNVPLNLTGLNPVIAKVRVFCEVNSTSGGSNATVIDIAGGRYNGTVTVAVPVVPTNATPGATMRYQCSLAPLDGHGNPLVFGDFVHSPATGSFTW
jgi:hypothetical protein